MKAMRKREAEEEGKWSRVMRKREDVDEDEDEEDDVDEVKNEENEPDHETDAEEEHRSILQ